MTANEQGPLEVFVERLCAVLDTGRAAGVMEAIMAAIERDEEFRGVIHSAYVFFRLLDAAAGAASLVLGPSVED